MHCYECDVCPACEDGRCDLCALCSCKQHHSGVSKSPHKALDPENMIETQLQIIRSTPNLHQIMMPMDICHLNDDELTEVLRRLQEIHELIEYARE